MSAFVHNSQVVLDCWRFQKKHTAGWKLRRFFVFLHTNFGYTRRQAWTFVHRFISFIYLCQGPVAAVALVLPWFRQQFSAGRDAPNDTPASLVSLIKVAGHLKRQKLLQSRGCCQNWLGTFTGWSNRCNSFEAMKSCVFFGVGHVFFKNRLCLAMSKWATSWGLSTNQIAFHVNHLKASWTEA